MAKGFKEIANKVGKIPRGVPFFADNFSSFGNAPSIRHTLGKLVKAGQVIRVARGIYVRQKFDEVIAPLTPTIDEIAKAIAKRDRTRIIPTGIYALNELGLSTQVPMNVIYLTDGTGRKIKIGRRTLTFKRTTPRNVAAIGKISCMVIQALRVIGKSNVTEDRIRHIHMVLKHEDPTNVIHDMRLAPGWIREIMRGSLG